MHRSGDHKDTPASSGMAPEVDDAKTIDPLRATADVIIDEFLKVGASESGYQRSFEIASEAITRFMPCIIEKNLGEGKEPTVDKWMSPSSPHFPLPPQQAKFIQLLRERLEAEIKSSGKEVANPARETAIVTMRDFLNRNWPPGMGPLPVCRITFTQIPAPPSPLGFTLTNDPYPTREGHRFNTAALINWIEREERQGRVALNPNNKEPIHPEDRKAIMELKDNTEVQIQLAEYAKAARLAAAEGRPSLFSICCWGGLLIGGAIVGVGAGVCGLAAIGMGIAQWAGASVPWSDLLIFLYAGGALGVPCGGWLASVALADDFRSWREAQQPQQGLAMRAPESKGDESEITRMRNLMLEKYDNARVITIRSSPSSTLLSATGLGCDLTAREGARATPIAPPPSELSAHAASPSPAPVSETKQNALVWEEAKQAMIRLSAQFDPNTPLGKDLNEINTLLAKERLHENNVALDRVLTRTIPQLPQAQVSALINLKKEVFRMIQQQQSPPDKQKEREPHTGRHSSP